MGYVARHREAVEYDLLTKTGHQIDDIGGTLAWGAVASFLTKLTADSATVREQNPEVGRWASTTKTNTILADIYDVLAAINANLVRMGHGKPKQPEPYPRPGQKKKNKHLGTAIPSEALHKWIEEKRKKHG